MSDHADLAAVQSVIRASLRDSSTLWGRGQHILSDIINFTGRFGMQTLYHLNFHNKLYSRGSQPEDLGDPAISN